MCAFVLTCYYPCLSDSSLATAFPTFCDKTFEFAIQTWQTSLEHYYVYVQTYFLSQLCKMLTLLISSYCKMCTLLKIQYCVSVCYKQYKHARSNEQNQHFAELRQKVCVYMYIHVVLLLTCLPSLDGKLHDMCRFEMLRGAYMWGSNI